MRQRAETFHLSGELKNEERRERRENQHRKNRVADKRAAQEKITEACERIGQKNSAAENSNRGQVGFAVGVERHAAGQQHADHVHIRQQP